MIFDFNDIYYSWISVLQKKSSGGIDNISIADFKSNEKRYCTEIVERLKDKKYLPEAYLKIQIKKNKTEKRTLGLATLFDKIVQTAIKNHIEKRIESSFMNNSYAYREGRSARKAINKVRYYISSEKYYWLAKCDIDNFFDNIDHNRLAKQLKPFVKNNYLMNLIMMFLKMGYVDYDNKWTTRTKGVPQGAVLSPLFANLYLTPLDNHIKKYEIGYVRYADDFVILAKSENKARSALEGIIEFVTSRLKLNLNKGYYVKHTSLGFKFLGIWITDKNIILPTDKIERLKQKISKSFYHHNFPDKLFETINGVNAYYGRVIPQHYLFPLDEFIFSIWRKKLKKNKKLRSKKKLKKALIHLRFVTDIYNQNINYHKKRIVDDIYKSLKAKQILSADKAVNIRKRQYEKLASANNHLYIGGIGKIIGVSKNNLRIKEKKKKAVKIPARNIKSIIIGGKGISLSTNFIRFCTDKKITVDFVGKSGKPFAKIYDYQSLHNKVWLKQIVATENDSLYIAKNITIAKLSNQIKLIKYFSKYAKKREKDILNALPEILNDLENIKTEIKEISIENNMKNKNVLMGYEGAAGSIYWHWVRMMLDEETDFEHREYQGANDVVNMMLNYGYGILYRMIWSSVLQHGLHPELGFLHSIEHKKAALIFDLIEPFRQPLVDRAIISIVNRKSRLNTENNLLSPETKRKVILYVNKKLGSYDTYLGERTTLLSIINRQTRELKKYLLNEIKVFKPYQMSKW